MDIENVGYEAELHEEDQTWKARHAEVMNQVYDEEYRWKKWGIWLVHDEIEPEY